MAYGIKTKDESTGAIISFLRDAATQSRTRTLPDVDGTIAMQTNRTAVAYVETDGSDTTGAVGKPDRPFATIGAALDALPSTGGVIRIGIGDFDAPPDDQSGSSKLKNNVVYIGAKRPWIDSTYSVNTFPTIPSHTAPTKLQNGTVIKGKMAHIGRNNIEFHNLGVDVGSAFCTAQGGGYASGANCLAFADANSGTGSAPTTIHKGLLIDNVVLLGQSATSAFHCLVIESAFKCKVSNVYTFFNTWGVAAKTQHSIFENIFCAGHNNGGFIFKGDVYAGCQGNILNNFQIGSIASFDGGGFVLEGGGAATYKNLITNGYAFGTKFGYNFLATQAILLNRMIGLQASSCTQYGFQTTGANMQTNEWISCMAQACGTGGFLASTGNLLIIRDFHAYNNVGANIDGLNISSGVTAYVSNIVSTGNGRYGLNNAGTCKRDGSYYSGNATAAENGTITGTA